MSAIVVQVMCFGYLRMMVKSQAVIKIPKVFNSVDSIRNEVYSYYTTDSTSGNLRYLYGMLQRTGVLRNPYPTGNNLRLGQVATSPVAGQRALSLFPNPATQAITVQLQVEERTTGTLEVYGLSGQLVLRQQVVFENSGSGVVVNIAELPNGLYSVVVRTGLGVPYVKRFVKAE